ncbi:hypothetical protein AM501_30990 [Aneurinibacillus migulanus]|uniref:metallophosphoesterase family protein n=1 Tax=Aneurinibacillus migulanus TaxID=47500 RepID=UPI0005BE4E24|nr:metallophosphoesterase [Aneurinibacillus migulanus]KIV49923.1 hypothetical protein TS64_29440 [Aneurinibacillus migulanus]KPD04594.1 hypothetical protein AM501_30990 [Aneurinibacillus migulanus]
MKIERIDTEPTEQLGYISAGAGGISIVETKLPIYKGYVSDLPGHIDALIVTSDLQGIIRKAQEDILLGEALSEYLALLIEIEWPWIRIDKTGVLLCGDLYADSGKRGGSGNPVSVWQAFYRSFGWVTGVAGNHDLLDSVGLCFLQETERIQFIERPAIVNMESFTIAGLGGIIGRPDKPNRIAEAEYLRALRKLLTKQPHCMLLHQSPGFPERFLEGNEQIRKTIEASPGTVVFCGHSHWDTSLVHLTNGTQVLNADGKIFILLRV